MDIRTEPGPATMEVLRSEYRRAFDRWALQIGRLHRSRADEAQDGSQSDAGDNAEAAELQYRQARDRLAANLMHDPRR